MMNACVETTRPFGVKTMVSLNAIMVDGTGMCGSCRVTVGTEVQVRLRRRPGLRRPPGRLQGAAGPPEALQGRGDARPTRTTPTSATWRSSSSRRTSATTRRSRTCRRTRPRCPSATPLERVAQLQGGQPRLLAARRAGRGRALHPVHQADLHLRLPGGTSTSRASSATWWCATSTARWRSSTRPPSSRRCAAASARRRRSARPSASSAKKVESVGIGRLERFVGDNARPKPVVPPVFAPGEQAGQGGDLRLRPGRPGGGGRPGEVRLRRHRLRGAARGGRRAPLRHPLLPPAARHHRPRGEAASSTWA